MHTRDPSPDQIWIADVVLSLLPATDEFFGRAKGALIPSTVDTRNVH
jgi:hypothetical protein